MRGEEVRGLQALVVGGSLAGLTSALAMARIGARATVLERASVRRSGAALAVHPADLEGVIGHEAAAVVFDHLAGPGHRPRRSQSVAWEDLRDGLAQAALVNPSISLLEGRRVESVGEDAQAAWARSDDGTEHRAHVLIGADGHRSRVRRHVAPERPDADFAGYLLWVGIAHERDLGLSEPWPAGLDIQSSGDQILLGYPLPGPDGSLQPGMRRLGWAWYDASRSSLLASTGAVRDGVVRHSIHASDRRRSQPRRLPPKRAARPGLRRVAHLRARPPHVSPTPRPVRTRLQSFLRREMTVENRTLDAGSAGKRMRSIRMCATLVYVDETYPNSFSIALGRSQS